MVEQHINPAGTVAYNKFFLSAYKRKTSAEFKKKPGDILFKSCLKLLFSIIDRDRYKPKVIVVFSDFLRHTALRLWQIFPEVADRFAVGFIQIGLQ